MRHNSVLFYIHCAFLHVHKATLDLMGTSWLCPILHWGGIYCLNLWNLLATIPWAFAAFYGMWTVVKQDGSLMTGAIIRAQLCPTLCQPFISFWLEKQDWCTLNKPKLLKGGTHLEDRWEGWGSSGRAPACLASVRLWVQPQYCQRKNRKRWENKMK
jgi:hypothetical protein